MIARAQSRAVMSQFLAEGIFDAPHAPHSDLRVLRLFFCCFCATTCANVGLRSCTCCLIIQQFDCQPIVSGLAACELLAAAA
jgi:hypothetical protein